MNNIYQFVIISDCPQYSLTKQSDEGVYANCIHLSFLKQSSLAECMDEACKESANVFNFYPPNGEDCSDPNTCVVTDAECWIKRCAALDNIPWGNDSYGADVWMAPHG